MGYTVCHNQWRILFVPLVSNIQSSSWIYMIYLPPLSRFSFLHGGSHIIDSRNIFVIPVFPWLLWYSCYDTVCVTCITSYVVKCLQIVNTQLCPTNFCASYLCLEISFCFIFIKATLLITWLLNLTPKEFYGSFLKSTLSTGLLI